LRELIIELTNRCIRDCIHCSSSANEGVGQLLNPGIIKEKLKLYRPEYVSISGGEPTLHPNLRDIIHLIIKNNAQIKLYTTLYYKYHQYIDEICISCYGDNNMNLIITKTDYDPFTLIKHYRMDGIIPTIHIVPMNINIDHIDKLIRDCLIIGIKKIKILKLVNQGRCTSDLIPDNSKLITLYNEYKDTPEVLFGLPFMHECVAGIDKIVLIPNGKVIPCETYKDGICKCEKLIM